MSRYALSCVMKEVKKSRLPSSVTTSTALGTTSAVRALTICVTFCSAMILRRSTPNTLL